MKDERFIQQTLRLANERKIQLGKELQALQTERKKCLADLSRQREELRVFTESYKRIVQREAELLAERAELDYVRDTYEIPEPNDE